MNLAQNMDNLESTLAEDKTGLAEIEQALAEIEKLKDDSEPQEENAEIEQDQDEDVQQVTSKEQEQIEKVQKKLWKEQKRKYQAIAEKEAFREENEKLKQMLNESLNSGTYHYGKSAYADLERAKENKKKAIESGDVDGLVEADIALNKAIFTVNDLEKWAYNSSDSNKTQGMAPSNSLPEQSQSYYNEIQHEIASDWLDSHPDLQPNTKNYNPQLANKVSEFINHLDANLAKNNQMDAYFSDQYFQTIDKFIEEAKSKVQKNVKNIEASNHIGGVRNSYGSSPNNNVPKQMILTADEKKMAANAGISEKDWLRYKLEDLKKGK